MKRVLCAVIVCLGLLAIYDARAQSMPAGGVAAVPKETPAYTNDLSLRVAVNHPASAWRNLRPRPDLGAPRTCAFVLDLAQGLDTPDPTAVYDSCVQWLDAQSIPHGRYVSPATRLGLHMRKHPAEAIPYESAISDAIRRPVADLCGNYVVGVYSNGGRIDRAWFLAQQAATAGPLIAAHVAGARIVFLDNCDLASNADRLEIVKTLNAALRPGQTLIINGGAVWKWPMSTLGTALDDCHGVLFEQWPADAVGWKASSDRVELIVRRGRMAILRTPPERKDQTATEIRTRWPGAGVFIADGGNYARWMAGTAAAAAGL